MAAGGAATAGLVRADSLAPVTHYSCPSDNSNNGHYVPANRYWEQDFVAQGISITGGSLGLGANSDGGDHRARVGIYTGSNRTGVLGEVVVAVDGYGGVRFSFPSPLSVTPGQHLWIATTGVGDFTAYDQAPSGGTEGCFIGDVQGFASGPDAPTTPAMPTPTVQTPPPAVPATTAPPSVRYAVADVVRVNLRGAPSSQAPKTGELAGNSPIDIVCQTVGEAVNGSPIWDRLTSGSYLSDWYITTPVVGDYSPGIPHCADAPADAHPAVTGGRWSIAATTVVNLREGPGIGYNAVGSLAPKARFDIACQTYGSYYMGSPIWDRLPDGRYVHDYFTDTPVFGDFSPGLAICEGTGARPPAPAAGGGTDTGGGVAVGGAQRADYVALGDSFSSGEGSPDDGAAFFTLGQDCHRSSLAYPVRFARIVGADLTVFAACSGAVTDDLLGRAQLGAIPSGGARLVTLTIGGNDLGFANILAGCIAHASCDRLYANTEKRIADFTPKLENVYRLVKDRARGGRVVVLGYPKLFPTPGRQCAQAVTISAGEQNWVDDRIVQFDAMARAAASTAGVGFINPDGRAFIGHDVCSDTAWINGINLPPFKEYSFHPNALGHLAMAQALVNQGIR